jgi:hypothetical protein
MVLAATPDNRVKIHSKIVRRWKALDGKVREVGQCRKEHLFIYTYLFNFIIFLWCWGSDPQPVHAKQVLFH